jgi:hypothetical protein
VPTSQPSITPNIPQTNPYAQQPAPTGQSEKRQRKPLAIVDPVSHKAVELSTQPPSSSSSTTNPVSSSTTTTTETRPTEIVTDSTIANDTNKTQKQTDFRHQFAKLLTDKTDSSSAPTDKVHTNQLPAPSGASNEDPPGAAPTKQHSHKQSEPVVQQSTSSASSSRSGSISRSKSPSSGQPQQAYPGIRTRTLTDDKRERNDSQKQDDKRERSDSQKQDDTRERSDSQKQDDTRERSDSQKQQEIEPIDDSKSTVKKIVSIIISFMSPMTHI